MNDCAFGDGTGPRKALPLRAAIVAANVVIGEGLRSILRSTPVQVAGLMRPGAQALERIRALAPDLIFMEAEALNPEDRWHEGLRRVAPRAAVIVIGFHEPVNVAQAVAIGAAAYLCRDVSPQHLLLTMDAALQGYVLLERSALQALSSASPQERTARCRDLVPSMTPREWEVLDLLAQGLGNGEIAARLVVSVGTVRSHVSRILRKLQVPDRVHAALWAAQHGLGPTRQTIPGRLERY